MRIGSLFSGAGGLDMAVEAVFGGTVAWHCELDKAASKVLAARWPGVPNLGDITTMADAWDWVDRVDVLCGGWPCQPFSLAGKRKGADDERALWPYVAGAVRMVRPRIVVLENVSAVLGPEFQRVANDLAALGYDIAWTCLRASDVGAPHRRERVFIIAHATSLGCEWGSRAGAEPHRSGQRESRSDADRRGADAPHSPRDGWHEGWPESAGIVGGSDATERGNGPVGPVELLPTPCAQQSGNTPENHLAKKPGRQRVTDLAILVENGLLATGGELLPTPSASDGTGGKINRSGDRKSELLLGGVARELGHRLLPTPTSRDHKGANQRSDETCLTGALLPPPSAADGARGQDLARANREGSGGDDLVTLAVKATGADQWGKYAPAIARWEQIAGPAPSPTELNRNGNPRLNPAFSEWMMGWPAGWVTDLVLPLSDPRPDKLSRNDALRIIGNGVVPQQAYAALTWLLSVCEVAA